MPPDLCPSCKTVFFPVSIKKFLILNLANCINSQFNACIVKPFFKILLLCTLPGPGLELSNTSLYKATQSNFTFSAELYSALCLTTELSEHQFMQIIQMSQMSSARQSGVKRITLVQNFRVFMIFDAYRCSQKSSGLSSAHNSTSCQMKAYTHPVHAQVNQVSCE